MIVAAAVVAERQVQAQKNSLKLDVPTDLNLQQYISALIDIDLLSLF